MKNIRNFVIIAHIDHGKSTLADRLLEVTKTVENRLMTNQHLDQMELERERGITIKMTPVRMDYELSGTKYVLNLIDTPGHSDFQYEVSRALEAVEGAILLVDATQGIQAQTLSTYETARRAGLKIIGAANKVDAATKDQVEETIMQLATLLQQDPDEIVQCSGKTGVGVLEILQAVITKVPPPTEKQFELPAARGLIFDSNYDEHRGVVAYIRVFSGEFSVNANYHLVATGATAKTKDLGYLRPQYQGQAKIQNGEIGYIATGIKDPDLLKIGDTITTVKPTTKEEAQKLALPGYKEPNPVVFVSFYPEDSDDYDDFKKALSKLRLSDSALQFEPDKSEVLGRGFKGGFLGRLHFEIITERILREFHVPVTSSFPSVAYQVELDAKDTKFIEEHELKSAEKLNTYWVHSPKDFPPDAHAVFEPMTLIEILTPTSYLGAILGLSDLYRLSEIETKNLEGSDRMRITAKLPLADLISDFDDKLKSVSQGFGSLSYEIVGYEKADVDMLEILVADNVMPGLTRILPRADIEREARRTVEKLKNLLPKLQFSQAVQARHRSRIIARETVPALRKDVTGYLYGGDRTRKMKLWKKQQKGKKRLKERGEAEGRVQIPSSVFKELMKK